MILSSSVRSINLARCIAGALCAAKVLRAVTPADAGGLLGCTLTGDDVGQLRGLFVEFFCSLIFVFVVCAGLIGTGSAVEECRTAASVASTEGSEFCPSRPVAAPFVAGATITGLSVFAVRYAVYSSISLLNFIY